MYRTTLSAVNSGETAVPPDVFWYLQCGEQNVVSRLADHGITVVDTQVREIFRDLQSLQT